MRRHLCLLLLTAALGGCGARRAGRTAEVAVELTGGPNPGRFQSTASAPTCSRGLVGPRSWAVQYSDWTGPRNGLRSLQLVVPAPERPEGFYLGMVFGDFFAGTVHEIETRPGAARTRGTGRVTLQAAASGTVVTIRGATSDTVAILATITCQTPDSTEGTVP